MSRPCADLTNMQVNGLRFLRKENGVWLVRCYCGQQFSAKPHNAHRIKKGQIRSCGCLIAKTAKRSAENRIVDRKGLIHNRLTFLSLSEELTGGNRKWDIRCHCGKIFTAYPHNILKNLTTSCGCWNIKVLKSRCGKNSSSYNHLLQDEDRIQNRRTPAYRAWAITVIQRDKRTCQNCSKKTHSVHAHHLDGYHWCVERRLDIENGITLCSDCHDLFHYMYSNQNNTKQQFEEFKEWYKTYESE